MDQRMTASVAAYDGPKNGAVERTPTLGDIGNGTYLALCSCVNAVARIENAIHGPVLDTGGAGELRSTPPILSGMRENRDLAEELSKRLAELAAVIDSTQADRIR